MSNDNGEPQFPGAPEPQVPGAPGPGQQQPPQGPPPGYGPPPGFAPPPPQGQPPQGPPPGYGPPPQGPPPQGPPPQGPPQQQPPGYGPPPQGSPQPGFGPPPESEPPAEEKPKSGGVGWKVATGVCALLAAGALAWGLLQKSDADNAAQASAAQVEQMQAQIDADQKEDDALKAELEKAKQTQAEVSAKLKTTGKELKGQTQKLKDLQNQYNQAAKEAEQKNATLKDQVQAEQAKADLATKCAQVMATGLEVIYNAETPEKVMNDVAKEMQKASDSCQGVVSFS